MFELNEFYAVDRRILECGYIRYSPAETSKLILVRYISRYLEKIVFFFVK